MHLLAAVLPLLAFASAGHNPPHLRHRRLAHSIQQRDSGISSGAQYARDNAGHIDAYNAIKRSMRKRGQTCRPRQKLEEAVSASSAPASSASSASSAAQTSSSATIENQNAWTPPSPTAAPPPPPSPSPPPPAPSPPPPQQNGNSGWAHSSGTLSVNDGRCGWCNSNNDNPNGSQDWLNCGLSNGGGWSPPYVRLDQLIAKDLNPNGVFAPCAQYFDLFRQYGGEFGIPPIMLASFAMQESTCNPWATGGGGEAGLMQIAPPNCEGGNDCYNVHYNVRRGAQLFSQMIGAHGGNVVAALGAYNGWRVGMTYDDATRARWQGNCLWQNNLDYLTQWLNGWIQDRNGYEIGSYWNLRDC